MAVAFVSNKDYLSDDANRTLEDSFNQSGRRWAPVNSRKDVKKKLYNIEEIRLPDGVAEDVKKFAGDGAAFWRDGIRAGSEEELFKNPFGYLYCAKKQKDKASQIRQAFYYIAIYKMIKIVMRKCNYEKFIPSLQERIACSIKVEYHPSAKKPTTKEIQNDLKHDFEKGKLYYQYVKVKGDYGIIFFMSILRPFM